MLPHIDETWMQRTFNQVVTLRDVREELVEVCITLAASYSEAGDWHEVCCNVVHIIGRLVIGPFVIGGVVTGLKEGRSSGTIAGSVTGKFEGGRQVVVSIYGRDRAVPSVSPLGSGLFDLFS